MLKEQREASVAMRFRDRSKRDRVEVMYCSTEPEHYLQERLRKLFSTHRRPQLPCRVFLPQLQVRLVIVLFRSAVWLHLCIVLSKYKARWFWYAAKERAESYEHIVWLCWLLQWFYEKAQVEDMEFSWLGSSHQIFLGLEAPATTVRFISRAYGALLTIVSLPLWIERG